MKKYFIFGLLFSGLFVFLSLQLAYSDGEVQTPHDVEVIENRISLQIERVLEEIQSDLEFCLNYTVDTPEEANQIKSAFLKKIELLDLFIKLLLTQEKIEKYISEKAQILFEARSVSITSTEGRVDKSFILLTKEELYEYMSDNTLANAIEAIKVFEDTVIDCHTAAMLPGYDRNSDSDLALVKAMAAAVHGQEKKLIRSATASREAILILNFSLVAETLINIHNSIVSEIKIKGIEDQIIE